MTRRECLRWLATAPLVAAAGCSRTSREAAEPVAKHAAAGPVFRDVTREAKLSFVHSVGPRSRLLPEDMGSGLAWGDFDNDGYADLYVVNQAGAFGSGKLEGPGDRLYHNNGDGTFTDVTAAAGVGGKGFGMGVTAGDFDNDGNEDLYITNYDSAILYFRGVVADYPQSRFAAPALLKLVQIYRTLSYTQERQDTCDHLRQYYPQATGLAQQCPAADSSSAP